ncbi:nuclear transport factor 2 family protein [Desertifilum sp. FACHB-1129]|nr:MULTISPECIES: nuclear transport factor 2 family protein [Desertifilum]MBD2311316.1 nuclear transport factor 2 family protein [Desertifilum sp. FACHB-1129]MBD2321562.1 nuclear transport factor 2 family protein [Desertifilum sp. FACHB-866]MBD2331689.1 nuclear transport factor 2 family protein [Desertifilum sp. FACHB-868]MDA0212353.1 nuclear transport factor 2 family protein [Cyanobacteria bacterium FC1]
MKFLWIAILTVLLGQSVLGWSQVQPSIAASVMSISLSSDAIRTTIRQVASAWEAGDAEAIASPFADDAEFIVPGSCWRGREEIRQEAAKFAQTHTEVKITIKLIVVEGNLAFAEWDWQDVEKQSGKRTLAEDAIAVEFRDGKIIRWREYIDTDTPTPA